MGSPISELEREAGVQVILKHSWERERERGRKENGIEVEPRYNALINSAKSTRITEATMASELSRVWSRWASFHTDI